MENKKRSNKKRSNKKNNADSTSIDRLQQLMQGYAAQDVCLAFSGGIDSSLLLQLAVTQAKHTNTKVYAVTFDTVLHPSCDVDIAKKVAKEMGAIHHIIKVNELENPDILQNPRNRCYLCKKSLFEHLLQFARKNSVTCIMEGTNQDDLGQYRPGLQAVTELGVLSPLALAGVTKEEVRKFANELGISVAKRPSAPCLATRLPYGNTIDFTVLRKIEMGEAYIRALGFYNIRLRLHQDIVRLELDKEEFEKFMEVQKEVTEYLKSLGFRYVTLDLEGFRSGSMDE